MDKQTFEKIKKQIIVTKEAGATKDEIQDVNMNGLEMSAKLHGWTSTMLKMVKHKSTALTNCVFDNEAITYDEFMKEYEGRK